MIWCYMPVPGQLWWGWFKFCHGNYIHHIGLQLNAAKNEIFTTKPLDHPTYVEVSQDLVHVLHEGSSHKYFGRHIPGNSGRVELHHRKTIAWAKFNKHRTILTNKHVNLKLRLKFFNAVFTPAMLLSLHTLALTKVHLDSINVLQRKMLRSIVGWVRVNGEDLRRCDEWIIDSVWFWNSSLFHHGRNNLPNANFNLLPR